MALGLALWLVVAYAFAVDIAHHTPGEPYVDRATPILKRAAEKLHLTRGDNESD